MIVYGEVVIHRLPYVSNAEAKSWRPQI